ncbi:MAG: RluA family pseudouridine synthase [Pseudomonadota bacterium]
MSGVQHLTVAEDEAEQRLDRWLKRQFPYLAQGRIEKLCRKGEVRVDGARVKGASRVAPGQVVRVPPLPEAAPPAAPAPPEPRGPDEAEAEAIRAAVLFCDPHMLVLNKPAGLAVQGGSGQLHHLGHLLPALRFEREDVPRLVHRLDKDTSGLLVLARTGAAAVALAHAFRSRAVEKIYFALVAGRPQPKAGTIRFGLVKGGSEGGEKMQILHPEQVRETGGARHATTDFRVIEQVAGRCAWVALRPVTGRTHQLRAHMAALGTPIAGDGKYGGRGQENRGEGWGAGLGAGISRRLHLHAAWLALPHPVTGRTVRYAAPLPEHMAESWAFLGLDPTAVPDPLFPD